jgi:translation elongation factor EF-4
MQITGGTTLLQLSILVSVLNAILQLTGTIEKGQGRGNKQVLDKLKVERERGITGTTFRQIRCNITDLNFT